jgi:hypothetical protein
MAFAGRARRPPLSAISMQIVAVIPYASMRDVVHGAT